MSAFIFSDVFHYFGTCIYLELFYFSCIASWLLNRGLNMRIFASQETFSLWEIGSSNLINKSGYHHMGILPTHWKFHGFSWTLVWKKKWFAFSVLPFGLSSALYVFTKIQKALVKHWWEQVICNITYLDDGAGADKTLAAAERSIIWVPRQCIDGLKERIDQVACHKCTTTARQLASLVETVVSMGLALCPVSLLWTRAMYMNIYLLNSDHSALHSPLTHWKRCSSRRLSWSAYLEGQKQDRCHILFRFKCKWRYLHYRVHQNHPSQQGWSSLHILRWADS